MTNTTFQQIKEAVDAAASILLLSHVRPDGDAIGSQLALALALRQTGKTVTAWNEDGVPASLAFLAESPLITQPPKEPAQFDLVIALDTATKQRVGSDCLAAIAGMPKWINIDHHESNPCYGDLNHIDTAAPATAQIVYEFLRATGLPLMPAAVDAIYVGISTDTGSFQYPNATGRTYEIAAELVKAGADVGRLNLLTYQSMPRPRFGLMKRMLAATRFDGDGALASTVITRVDLEAEGAQPDDTENLIDLIRAVDGVVVAAFFEELHTGKVRISLRSKNSVRVDVSKICLALGGGGHPAAAGARAPGPIDATRERVLQMILNELKQ